MRKTSIRKSPGRITAKAYDIASAFDMKAAREIIEKKIGAKIINSSPLLADAGNSRMFAIFDYGSVVFFNFNDDDIMEIRNRIMITATRPNKIVSEDDFAIFTGKRTGQIESTDWLNIPEFTRDYALIVSAVLSRSVSMEYYESQVNNALANFEEIVNSLSTNGKMHGSRAELTKRVGFGLAVEHELAYNLSIFDDPDIIWEGGEKMNQIYTQMKQAFDIEDRIDIIQQKLSIISRSSMFIISRLEARKSNMLEWIIIILILFEIVLFLLGKG